MFTGIVETVGRVRAVSGSSATGLRLSVDTARLDRKGLRVGSSIAVNGVCLSVVKRAPAHATFQVVRETLRRTNLARLRPGDPVNLERPLRWRGRVDGHFVSGHVDACGRVLRLTRRPARATFVIGFPAPLRKFFTTKGSVAVDGVSLTLGRVGPRAFTVHIIGHTLRHTLFGAYRTGSIVNLEADLSAKLRVGRRSG